jgi:predicted RNA polymerase sigma factor
VAVLVGAFGDVDVAEEAVADALCAAVGRCPDLAMKGRRAYVIVHDKNAYQWAD